MLSFKRVVKILQAADFIILIPDDGQRHVASVVDFDEPEDGEEQGDFTVAADEVDDVTFQWELKYEMRSYRRGDGAFLRGFRIDCCWVIPVKAGRA